jgi:hypothetical protein
MLKEKKGESRSAGVGDEAKSFCKSFSVDDII